MQVHLSFRNHLGKCYIHYAANLSIYMQTIYVRLNKQYTSVLFYKKQCDIPLPVFLIFQKKPLIYSLFFLEIDPILYRGEKGIGFFTTRDSWGILSIYFQYILVSFLGPIFGCFTLGQFRHYGYFSSLF